MTYVKICGITNLEDALVAADTGADMLGFVFVSSSPRCITSERAREIVTALKRRGSVPRFVGVFVNESLERVRAILETAQLDLAQLHGNESPQMVYALSDCHPERSEGSQSCVKEILTLPLHSAQGQGFGCAQNDKTVICRACKALRPRDEAEAQARVEEYRAVVRGSVPAFIVDAFDAQQSGGTGARADWNIAAQIAREFPILLAGGLNVGNVVDALRVVRPWGVDVSSGVERAPGRKDHAKVWQFIRNAKSVD